MRWIVVPLLLGLLAGCGGSGGGGDSGGDQANPGPEIALLFCSGHQVVAAPYLDATIGPVLENALSAAGYSYVTWHFADDEGGGSTLGYTELVSVLESIRDDWITGHADPTRVIVVAHSHGGVRAHSAIRAVPDCPVRLLVDLDNSSYGWTAVHFFEDVSVMGGHPEDAHSIAVNGACTGWPLVPNDPGPGYDVEDVVFPSVTEALEVRSGEEVVAGLTEQFDEHWNVRLDGTSAGLTCFYSDTDHSEVHSDTGTTVVFVETWILARLASDGAGP